MGEYKVVFRIDSETDQDGRGLTWEPGCPLSFVALQVSRDVDSGRAFLQAKVWNISAEQVSSFKGELSCSFKDGSEERFPVEFLDADIASREKYTLKPVELPRGDAVFVTGRIVELSTTSGDWRSSSEPSALPQGRLLDLTEKALRERALQLEQRRCRASVAAAPYAVEEHDGWVLCACGQVSVGMERCPSCGLRFLEDDCGIEDEETLASLANERARRIEEDERVRRERKEKTKADAVGLAKRILPVVCVALAVLLGGGFAVSAALKSSKYSDALALEESGSYVEALHGFAEISSYKDSSEHLDSLIDELVMSESELPVEKAVEYLSLHSDGNEVLLETCECMLLLEGNEYVQTSKYGSYYLSADYYLNEGEPLADVRYTNYLGYFYRGSGVTLSSASGYLIDIHAKGVYRGSAEYMDFNIGEKRACTNFGSGYDFELGGDE